MTRGKFEAIVRSALKKLPKEFREKLENVDVVIEDGPDMAAARRLGLGGKGHLLGLYEGVPLKERTHYYGMVMPDKITLFRKNIERSCGEDGTDIREAVAHVIQHEIAHHFGISDARLRDLDIY